MWSADITKHSHGNEVWAAEWWDDMGTRSQIQLHPYAGGNTSCVFGRRIEALLTHPGHVQSMDEAKHPAKTLIRSVIIACIIRDCIPELADLCICSHL